MRLRQLQAPPVDARVLLSKTVSEVFVKIHCLDRFDRVIPR